jgi:hypothetical protein
LATTCCDRAAIAGSGVGGVAYCDIGEVEVLEPSRWWLLAAGLGCLVALHRVGRRT